MRDSDPFRRKSGYVNVDSIDIDLMVNPKDIMPSSAAKIKVIGVGGGGGNAVNRMIASEVSGVEFWCVNTDSQALVLSIRSERLQVGQKLTRGLGAGGNPAFVKAAEESRDEVANALNHADLVLSRPAWAAVRKTPFPLWLRWLRKWAL